jgi:hypothetical protein
MEGKVGAMLYFGYTGLMVLAFWLLTGLYDVVWLC